MGLVTTTCGMRAAATADKRGSNRLHMFLLTPRHCGGIIPICCVLLLRREGAECRHTYTLECIQEAKSHFPLPISKQTAQIVVCRTVESCCKGGAVHDFEAPDH